MSVYYYLICEAHHERCEAASVSGSVRRLGESEVTLPAFVVAHEGCQVVSVDEHDPRAEDAGYKDWTIASMKET